MHERATLPRRGIEKSHVRSVAQSDQIQHSHRRGAAHTARARPADASTPGATAATATIVATATALHALPMWLLLRAHCRTGTAIRTVLGQSQQGARSLLGADDAGLGRLAMEETPWPDSG